MKCKRKTALAAGAIATVLAASAFPAYADGRGPCQGEGWGWNRMANHDFTAKEIRTLAEARLLMRGNDNLKVGDIIENDDGTYTVRIVTKDDSLVREMRMNRTTGRPMRGS